MCVLHFTVCVCPVEDTVTQMSSSSPQLHAAAAADDTTAIHTVLATGTDINTLDEVIVCVCLHSSGTWTQGVKRVVVCGCSLVPPPFTLQQIDAVLGHCDTLLKLERMSMLPMQ